MGDHYSQYGRGGNFPHSEVRTPSDPNEAAYVKDLQDERLKRDLRGSVVAYHRGRRIADATSEKKLAEELSGKRLDEAILVVVFGTQNAKHFTPEQVRAILDRRR
ncbi:hypothetical protein J4234_01780 [Candidatus Woesearchaeota archaeon]|nr:hypothetical protein [Candidatus Woesearchaeota archaeon]